MGEEKRRVSPVVFVGDGLLLLCALLGLTTSFLSLYTGPDAAPWADVSVLSRCAADGAWFLRWAALFALLSLCAWSLPRFRWAAAGALAGVWLSAVCFYWEEAVTGAGFTAKAIADLFSARVDWGRTFSFETGLALNPAAQRTRLFLLLALAGLALALGWAVVRARRWWVVALLTLPPLLPGLLADFYPDWPPFLALCACWCAMLLCDLCRWAAPSGRGRLTLAALAASALVLGGLTLLLPQEGYTRPAWALRAEEGLYATANRLSDFFSRWDGPFQGPAVTYVGAAEEADLAAAGPLNYSGRTVLRVQTDYDGRLYLRGSSLAVYEDGLWKPLPEGTWQSWVDGLDAQAANAGSLPLVLPAYLASSWEDYTITVENLGAAGSCVYAPYFLPTQSWDELGMMPMEDSYFARRQGQWEHTMVFRSLTFGSAPDQAHTEEWLVQPGSVGSNSTSPDPANMKEWLAQPLAAYRDYVTDHYLDVPDELRDTLNLYAGMWHATRSSYDSGLRNYDSIQLAQEFGSFLGTFCQYDINAPAAPEGTDPVLYFLQESRRGYCMHYASAVTLMLRAQGIPARYVSGFSAQCRPGQIESIPDRAAHAWVEVWTDRYGWYPVEVTPAAAFDWYEDGAVGPEDLPSDPLPESETPEPTPTPSQEPDGPDTSAPPLSEDETGTDTPAFALPGWVRWAALAALVPLLLWLGQFALKRRRARRMDGPDPNRAALFCYGCLERLARWGGRIDPRALELAQRARFSQHTITPDELDELRLLVDWERRRLCTGLPPVKRALLRYLWGTPPRPKSGKKPENDWENRA